MEKGIDASVVVMTEVSLAFVVWESRDTAGKWIARDPASGATRTGDSMEDALDSLRKAVTDLSERGAKAWARR